MPVRLWRVVNYNYLLFNWIVIMNVKFTVDYDLIELVDAIGLDYDIVNVESDVIKNYKEIVIECEQVDELVEDPELLEILSDEELCEYILNPTLCEGLIYTERLYDSDERINEEIQFESIIKSKML